MPDTSELAGVFAELRTHYAGQLSAKVVRVEQHWAGLSDDPAGAPDLKAFYFLVHQICGSSGSFGFMEVSLAARALESQLSAWLQHGTIPDGDGWRQMEQDVATLIDEILAVSKATTPSRRRPAGWHNTSSSEAA